MLLRPLRDEERALYNQVVRHPLQSWEWGEFRRKTGQQVERVGFFENGTLVKALQVTFHDAPLFTSLTGQRIGYFPRGDMPDEEQFAALRQLGQANQAIFIKMEPNIAQKVDTPSAHKHIREFLEKNQAKPGRALFTKYSFQLDLTQSVERLFENLHQKTRYNINLAHKKGVEIIEDTSAAGMAAYLEILQETTQRQGFYAHTPAYFQTMWDTLGNSGMMRIFQARYQGHILVSWIMFIFNGVLYYPYGASRNLYREVMPSNLMMWEMIQFGKNQGCTLFDMWGSLGPHPDPKDPWFGFHRFKKGYGGDLVEFMGTYDLVRHNSLYSAFKIAENIRWKALRWQTHIRRLLQKE